MLPGGSTHRLSSSVHLKRLSLWHDSLEKAEANLIPIHAAHVQVVTAGMRAGDCRQLWLVQSRINRLLRLYPASAPRYTWSDGLSFIFFERQAARIRAL